MSDKIPFTQSGLDKLFAELLELKNTKRPSAVDRLAKARSMGDLSENSEYQAAKEELAFVEGRIREIEELSKRAVVTTSQQGNGVNLGDEVLVEKDGVQETYFIVGEFEADPMQKKLSATSPIGKALLGKKEGESVDIQVPAGSMTFKIVKITK